MVTLRLTGTVEVTCQRSLHPMPWSLGRSTQLLLAKDAEEADRWDRDSDEAEVVVADHTLDAETLLEDEFLLSLPFAPLCEDPACGERLRGTVAPNMESENPFRALGAGKALKTTH
jgi:uncharacterized protein